MRRLLLVLSSVVLAVPAWAAFTVGGKAFTKRVSTDLLAEPKALSPAAAHVGFGQKLKVDEVKGMWLRVEQGASKGWVFAGNLSEDKPSDTKGMDGTPLAASQTSATAAARPLAPAAEEYGDRKGLAEAKADVIWMEGEGDAIKPDQVDAFLQQNKKGEFQ
jgi:hypothetical protein